MVSRRGNLLLVVGLVPSIILAAGCSHVRAGATSTTSTSSSAGSVSSPGGSKTPRASAKSPTAVDERSVELVAAQARFTQYYRAYVAAARHPATKTLPKPLRVMTDPMGPERDWLKKSFAEGRRDGGHITSGNVHITLGPETGTSGADHHEIRFQACIDPGDLKIDVGGKTKTLPWQLLAVKMRKRSGHSGTHKTDWFVYSKNDVGDGHRCGF